MNEDGRTDLVLWDFEDEMLGVMLGNGDGTFTEGSRFAGGAVLTGPLTLADFNGDQHLDVAIGTIDNASMNDRVVEVRFGNGAGSFSGAVRTSVGSYLRSFDTFDLDADGNTDLHIEGNGIYLGDGNGGFRFKTAITGEVAHGDFNHDGHLDLAVAAAQWDDWHVLLWFGAAGGTLTAGPKYPCGYPSEITAADLDSNGHADLLVTSYNGSVTVLRGKADGTFHAPETWVAGPNAYDILTDDFDRDGKIDFVTSIYDENDTRMAFVRGNGDGTFRTSHVRHTGSVVPVQSQRWKVSGGTIANMNGDDHPDVVISQQKPDSSSGGNVDFGVLLNDGTGRLAPPILTDAGIPAGSFAVRDVNNDGRMDIVTSAGYWALARTFLGNADGTFGSPISFSVSRPGTAFLGDFTGDSNLDLFINSGYSADVYPGNGSGTFAGAISTSHSGNFTATIADFNGDGKMDWLGSGISSQIAFINDGSGLFTPRVITTMGVQPGALADFDGDGKVDVLFTTYGGATATWFGKGDGTFSGPILFGIAPAPSAPAVTADFDGDGKMDIAFGTSVFLGNGDGRFRSRARAPLSDVTGVDAGDMDGNGSPDLVTVQSGADDVAVFLTRTTSDPTSNTSLALTSDQAVGQYGKQIKFTATVTGGVVPLTGAVTFAVDGTPQAVTKVDREGKATFYPAFAIGTYNVTATYDGDENYRSSTKSITQSVVKAQPTASIIGGPNPRPARQTVTIFVGVSAQQISGFAAPTGPLTLRDGDTPLNLTITSGQATTRDLAIGSHVISVDYPGDANYEPATASYTQVITKPVATIVVTAAPESPVYAGTTVTFRASSFSPGITGTITFAVGGTDQGTLNLVDGAAEIQLTLPWGTYFVQAKYSGDDNWAANTGYTNVEVLAGPWGTPVPVRASGRSDGELSISWGKVAGGVTYTLWRKKALAEPWEVVDIYGANTHGSFTWMEKNKTWMFAVTVTDANGNVSPMGPPDIATSGGPTSWTAIGGTAITAAHINELRAAIDSVREFAGLSKYAYANPIAVGQLIRASDIQQMRTAIAQARTTIGLPAMSFVDQPLMPGMTRIRALHMGELHAGTN